MGEETPETETTEEEIEEYELLPTTDVKEEPTVFPSKKEGKVPLKEPEKTTITRDKKVEGIDYCPYCEGTKIAKDYKRNIYFCETCGNAWKIEEK